MIPAKYWSPTKKLMVLGAMAGGKAVEAEATGNPVTFQTDLAKPLKSLVANFLPIQSSGTPSPENVLPITGWTEVNVGHCGKNMFNGVRENGYISDNGVIGSDGYNYHSELIRVEAGEKYTYSLVKNNESSSNKRIHGYDIDGEWVQLIKKEVVSEKGNISITFTVPNGVYFIRVQFYGGGGDFGEDTDIQIEQGETATSYEPYNGTVYPVTFPALGKNLANMQYGNKVPSVSNGQMVDSNGWSTPFIPIDTSKNYYLSRGGVIGNIYVMFYGSDYSFIRAVSTADNGSINTLNGFSECSFIKLRNDSASTATMEIQLEQNTQATSYAPYMNTVYGGYIDLVTGQLWATWNGIKKKWYEGESETDMGSGITRKVFNMVDNLQTGSANNKCNVAPYNANENANVHFYYSGSGATNRKARVFLPTETDGDTEILIITNVSVPILLATLSPTQINALIGNNTIWSDANGNIEVTYLKKA